MNRIEATFVAGIEDTLNEACVINGELRTENEMLKSGYTHIAERSDRLFATNSRKTRIITLLKSRIRRLEIKAAVWKNVSQYWEEIAMDYKRESVNRFAEIRSLKSELKSAETKYENAQAEIAALKRMQPIDMCEVEADFTEVPDIIGIAPCGNGCPVKRDGSGRMYDAHEITCEDSEEFAAFNL